MDIDDVRDFERVARSHLSSSAYAYIAGGSGDEQTRDENEAAFGRRQLRIGRPVRPDDVTLATSVLGQGVSSPIGLAPVARQGLADPAGELISAGVAARTGVVFCLSTFSSQSLEAVAAVGGGPRWFQLYVLRDRQVTEDLVARAVASAYTALVLTVDRPVLGRNERAIRDPLAEGEDELGNLAAYARRRDRAALSVDPSLGWRDIAWVRSLSGLPVVLKGILHPEDAAMAVEHGVSAVVVSNHGGRQLDRVPAAVDALPAVIDAVNGRADVYLDSGVRSGTDIAVALALGAKAVFVGRPYVFALAADGDRGVSKCLDLLAEQLRIAMARSGARSVSDLSPDLVVAAAS